MCAPGPFGDAPLMMSREVAGSSHKTKRVLLCYPGKPLLRLWLKREQAALGTDHHIVPLLAVLDTRDDMNRLGRRFGEGRGSGTRACGFGWRLGRAGWLGRSLWDGRLWPVLLKQASEISHLLLQRDELGLHGRKLLWQPEQIGGQRWDLAGKLSRSFFLRGSQTALMQASQRLEVLLAQPFFAAIVRMALQGKLRISQPAMQGFGINAQTPRRLGYRHKGHGTTPFVWGVQQNESQPEDFRGVFPEKVPGISQENSPEKFWEGQVARQRGLPGFLATATMIITGPILMGAPKNRPLADERSRSGSRKDQVGQQVAGFGGSQRDERGAGRRLGRWGRFREVALDGDAEQEGSGQQDERDMAVPAHITAHFRVVEPEGFASLQVLFDVPAGPDGLHHGGQGGIRGGPDQEIGHLVRLVEAATHHEPMATVRDPSLHQDRKSTRLNSSHLVISYAVF